MNELNFARFDAKLEQRLAESEVRLEQRIGAFEARLITAMSALEVSVERRFGDISRWMIGVWVTIILAAVALWFRH